MSCRNNVTLAILVHYYMSGEPYSEHDLDHANSDAVHDALVRLTDGGMLCCPKVARAGKIDFEITEKGRTFVEYLHKLPFPEQKWQMPEAPREGT